jgi:hypothetical protein
MTPTNSTPTHHDGCPDCAAKDAEIESLKAIVEMAVKSGVIHDTEYDGSCLVGCPGCEFDERLAAYRGQPDAAGRGKEKP